MCEQAASCQEKEGSTLPLAPTWLAHGCVAFLSLSLRSCRHTSPIALVARGSLLLIHKWPGVAMGQVMARGSRANQLLQGGDGDGVWASTVDLAESSWMVSKEVLVYIIASLLSTALLYRIASLLMTMVANTIADSKGIVEDALTTTEQKTDSVQVKLAPTAGDNPPLSVDAHEPHWGRSHV